MGKTKQLHGDLLGEFPFFKGFFEIEKAIIYAFTALINFKNRNKENFFVDSQEVQGYKIKIKKVGLVHAFMQVFFCVEIKTIGSALTAKIDQ